jgi:hypothetical protein
MSPVPRKRKQARCVRQETSFERLLVRIQSEGFELSAPFGGSVAESLDAYAAGQTTFDRGFDEVRCDRKTASGGQRRCMSGLAQTADIRRANRHVC